MSKRVLDVHLDQHWDGLVTQIGIELQARRDERSVEIFVERRPTAVGFGVEVGEPAPPVDAAGGKRWTRRVVPVCRFRTSVLTIDRWKLETLDAGSIEARAAELADAAIHLEHMAILYGFDADESGLLSAPGLGPESNEFRLEDLAGQPERVDPRSWVVVGPDGWQTAAPATGGQQIATPAAPPTSRAAYAIRFDGARPVVLHEAMPWRLVRLGDIDDSVQLCLEADWATEIRSAPVSGLEVMTLHDEPRIKTIEACQVETSNRIADRDLGLTEDRAVEARLGLRGVIRRLSQQPPGDRHRFEEPAMAAVDAWADRVRHRAEVLDRELEAVTDGRTIRSEDSD